MKYHQIHTTKNQSKNLVVRTTENKWNFAKHAGKKSTDESIKVIQWTGPRSRGRPNTKWSKEVTKVTGLKRIEAAQQKDTCKMLSEAYVLH